MEIFNLKMDAKIASKGKFIGSIYIFVNKSNNKIYIGKTILSCSERWSEHKYMAFKKNVINRFYNALRKYTWDGFDKFVIFQTEEFDTAKEADEIILLKEQFYIDLFRSDCPEFGYNSTKGGDGIIGYHHTAEAKALMSKIRSGSQHWNYGNRNKGIQCKPIIQLDLDFNIIAEYPSKAELARKYNCKSGDIKIGDNKKFRNTIIILKKNYSQDYLLKHYSNCKIVSNDKEVIQFDLQGNEINRFQSVSKASKYIKCDPSTIGYAASGKSKTAKGYIWIYANEYTDELKNDKINKI